MKQCRLRYSPKAQRLARPVVIVLSFDISELLYRKGMLPIFNPLRKHIALQEFALRVFLTLENTPSWRENLAAEAGGHRDAGDPRSPGRQGRDHDDPYCDGRRGRSGGER